MSTVKHIIGPTILLHSGAYLDFEAPEKSLFTIADIAQGLANLCRFTGQCRRFYSVAEHSVHASHIVPPEDALAALLHDAAEAFCGDVSKPLKTLLPEYRRIEARVEAVVFHNYGIRNPLPASVKLADLRMLRAEQAQAMGSDEPWPVVADLAPAAVKLQFWPPQEARQKFLERYVELNAIPVDAVAS